ncbi:MAG: hypothetical protein AB7N76_07825 [Planctomycetota bacterium]
MSDEELRELERRYRASGAEEDRRALDAALARAGEGLPALVVELDQTLRPYYELSRGRELPRLLERAIAGWERVAVDLDRVKILYSAQVGLLIHTRERLARGELVVCCTRAPTRAVLELLAVAELLRLSRAVPETLADLGWREAARVRVGYETHDD